MTGTDEAAARYAERRGTHTPERSDSGATFAGGCACGAIRYECSAEPVLSFNCHCRDCQRAGGGAFAPILIVPKAGFELVKGSTFTCGGCGREVTLAADRVFGEVNLDVAVPPLRGLA